MLINKESVSEPVPLISTFGRGGTMKTGGNNTMNGFSITTLHKAHISGDSDNTPEPIEEKRAEEEADKSRSNEAQLKQFSVERKDSIMSPLRSIYSPQRTLFEVPLNESISKLRTQREVGKPQRRFGFDHRQAKEATRAFFLAYTLLSDEQRTDVYQGLKGLMRHQGRIMLMSPGKRSMIDSIHSVQELSG
jgi:hypothetical protein